MENRNDPPQKDDKEPIKVSFSLPQLIGGALAAATAAAVGSTLGVAGTIIGAMVASVIGGVGGTLYSAGIDRTHRKVASVITRTGKTDIEPADGVDVTLVDTPAVPHSTVSAAGPSGEPPKRSKRIWKVAAITAAAIFAVSLVMITLVELGLGRALGGGDGTTVSQVVRPESRPTRTPSPTPTPSPSATTASPTATETPTPIPTPTPSEPTSTPTPSEPTESATPAAATEAAETTVAVESTPAA